MLSNQITNAQNFLRFYESSTSKNFGVNVCILTLFMEKYALFKISKDEFQNFLKVNRSTLENIDFRILTNMPGKMLEKFLKAIDPKQLLKWEIPQDSDFEKRINTQFGFLANADNYNEYGSAAALYHDTKLTTSHEDIVGRLPQDVLYPQDPNFKHWPINQIGKNFIYASMGFSENEAYVKSENGKYKIKPGNFFYEILTAKTGSEKGITHIIALGEINKDFPNYFGETKAGELRKYSGKIDGKKIEAQVKSKKIKDKNIDTYQLDCVLYIEGSKVPIRKTIIVPHLSLKDGNPVLFKSDEEMKDFYDDINKILKNGEGVVVHCKSGLGRTGQVIASILNIFNMELFSHIFSDNNRESILKKINEFVTNHLRAYRNGLIIVPLQLSYFLKHATNHLELTAKQESKKISTESLEKEFLPEESKLEEDFQVLNLDEIVENDSKVNLFQEITFKDNYKNNEVENPAVAEEIKKEHPLKKPISAQGSSDKKKSESLFGNVTSYFNFWGAANPVNKDDMAEERSALEKRS